MNEDTSKLLVDLHVKYIQSLDTKRDSLEYWMTEHLRLSGVYWGITALDLLNRKDALDREEMIEYVLSCQHENGGFGGHKDHDPHLLYTLSAIQILLIQDAKDRIDVDKVVEFVASRQDKETGSFSGDEWGETDTRFSYIALSACSLLGRMDAVDVPKAVEYIKECQNYDGGFGTTPGAESHSGQIFCCTAALAIADSLHVIDADLLGWWLCERQLPNGGLNGRPEKLEDVCYTWWVMSSLSILGRIHWINRDKLIAFILSAQDAETGGIADRPGDMVDVFHTMFGISGLSLLGYPGLAPIDPVYALPRKIVEKLGLSQRYHV